MLIIVDVNGIIDLMLNLKQQIRGKFEMLKHLLIWDLDDTLIYTNAEYEATNTNAAQIISKSILGDDSGTKEILILQRKIDLELVKEHGFIPSRYIKSWGTTYLECCNKHQVQSSDEVFKEIEVTVENIYQRSFQNIPEARKVLIQLRQQGIQMVLLTAGDVDIQTKRVKDAGIEEFFNFIHVKPSKTPQTLKELIELYPAEHHFMIGNSLKSDIYPALENDIWGIHLITKTWEADNHDIDTTHKRYMSIQNLEEIMALVSGIEIRNIA
jgi:putative hydrolase of the HAD superfamily